MGRPGLTRVFAAGFGLVLTGALPILIGAPAAWAASPIAEQGAAAQPADKPRAASAKSTAPANGQPEVPVEIDEYRVVGADGMAQIDVETAVYPFLGPRKTAKDVEQARAALEKAYRDRGFQAVTVTVPEQDIRRGFVILAVNETKVARLQVKGSRYFDLDQIKKAAPSVKEGTLLNINDVTNDLSRLNRWPDRRVTPALRAGVTPGTVDVDLNVEDSLPLHGSVELNNKKSANTSDLRAELSLRYDNLWQLGHSLAMTYQIAPLKPADTQAFSASYLARTDIDWLNILVYGLKSDSSVASVGSSQVVGGGSSLGARAVMTLPSLGDVYQTLSVGPDYKDYKQRLSLGSSAFSSPVTYVPLVVAYNASLQAEKRQTQYGATLTAGLRGIGSDTYEFDAKRYMATASFITLRSELSHLQEFDPGFQIFGRVQGQIANQPLISSEQLSLGGQDSVRGYLESEVLGDNGGLGTLELRSPNLLTLLGAGWSQDPGPLQGQGRDRSEGEGAASVEPGSATPAFNPFGELRLFTFYDVGHAWIMERLTDQRRQFDLASYGFGLRMNAFKAVNGMVYVANPTIKQGQTAANRAMVGFRVWGEF